MKRNFFILIILMFIFYKWTATSSLGFDFKREEFALSAGYGHYNLLAESFKKGHVYLDFEVPIGLKQIKDPYDPELNRSYRERFHDISFYKGKFYLYFGPSAVITLFLPYLLITGKHLPNNFCVFIFSMGTFIFSGLFLMLIRDKYFKKVPDWILTLAIANIGFSNLSLYLLRQPRIWEQADASGLFFISGTLYFLVKALHSSEKSKHIFLAIGSLFFGFSVGGRPHYILSSIILLIIFKEIYSKKTVVKDSLFLFLPYGLCLICLGLYNYFRFEDPFNFGIIYQLATYNLHKEGVFGNHNIVPSGYFYLFQPPTINSSFPFVHLNPSFPPNIASPKTYILETVAGIFPCIPFLWILVFSRPLIKVCLESRFLSEKVVFPKPEFLICLIPALINLCLILRINCAMMRHNCDYTNLLLLTTSIIWFYLYSLLKDESVIRFYTTILVTVLVIISMFIGLGMSIHGQYSGLEATRHDLYESISKSCAWLADILHYFSPLWGQR